MTTLNELRQHAAKQLVHLIHAVQRDNASEPDIRPALKTVDAIAAYAIALTPPPLRNARVTVTPAELAAATNARATPREDLNHHH